MRSQQLLQVAGACGLAMCGYSVSRFGFAMLSSCDADTAFARLPEDAYTGKVCWVTGASSGLGKEMARQLAAQNARLILSSRRKDVLDEFAAELRSAHPGVEVRVLPLDLGELDELDAKAEAALAAFGHVDVLLNNGGVSTRSTARDSSFDVDLWLTKVDFLSYVRLTKAVLPSMAARGGGLIINISSVAGKFGIGLRTAYCGAKHAVMGWFDALRVEEFAAGSGVRVMNVCPGSVRTNVARNAVLGTPTERLGHSDPNIESGLDAAWTCERILAAAAAGVEEAWIAQPKELAALFLGQYFPATAKTVVKAMGKTMMERALLKSNL